MSQTTNLSVLNATYKVEQSNGDGKRTIGTLWLVNLGTANNPKVAIVTAHHVFLGMKHSYAKVHWRLKDETGVWKRVPTDVRIRNDDGVPLWLHHPEKDIAVMWVDAPKEVLANALFFDNLADERTISNLDISLGDEMLALGYPRGLSANELGFPILRSGRVASYPVLPIKQFPSFLMDFSVFSGNSGGPVYMSDKILNRAIDGSYESRHYIAGLLSQQVNMDTERLEIGIVLHASFIRDILRELIGDDEDLIS